MEPVAIEVLGEPNKTLSTKAELRWGSRGSLCVNLIKGTWYDHENGDAGGGVLDFLRDKRKLDKTNAIQWLRDRGHLPPAGTNGKPKIVATYDYQDEIGNLLFQVVRFEPKDFRQRVPVGKGGWVWKMIGVRRVLYRLSEVIAGVETRRTIYIAEGEKGVAALETLGLVATCSPGGAGKWRPEYSASLCGADVVLLPDNDEPGRKHVAQVADSLHGVARQVRVLALSGLPEKGDIVDWITAGGTASEFANLVEAAAEPKCELNGSQNRYGVGTAKEQQPLNEARANEHIRSQTKTRPKTKNPDETLEEWRKCLQTDDRGQVIPNLANAAMALRLAPTLARLVAYDEMQCHALLRRRMPDSTMPSIIHPQSVHDADVSALQEWLQRHGIPRLGRDIAQQALDLVARENTFHPVRDYLSKLHWDGISRIDKWLSYHLGAEPSPYVASIGRWFLIAMVARIMKPGCKADYMLVLEGPQGAQKSTACAILAGVWFSDNLPDLHHGDRVRLSMHLRGKWLIEISEMASISKAEAGSLKAFLTQTEERYTPKFARNEVIEPRQGLFIGSTNKMIYLRDETGGRRFWPVVTGTIDIEALKHDRDQLFAEAMVAYRNGDKWWPDREFEAEYIKPEQEARFEADAWEQAVSKYLTEKERVTILEVAQKALFIDLPKIGTADQRRISAVLENIGWESTKRGTGGIRWWIRSVTQ